MGNDSYFYGKEYYYYKYRPSYSENAIQYLKNYLDNCNVIELGAGPGNLSKQLLGTTKLKQLTTIEPNLTFINYQYQNLQQYIQQKRCFIKQGYAENLENINAKIVIVGQAIHWFDKELFLRELKRIGCELLIILESWTTYDIRFFKKYRTNIITNKERLSSYFKNYTKKSFSNDLYFNTFEQFSGYMMSMSYAPEAPATIEEYINNCQKFWLKYSQIQYLCINGTIEVWIGTPF